MSEKEGESGRGVTFGEGFEGYKFRIVLLGEAAVGKTALIRRYTENVFDEEYKQTIGTTFATNDEKVEDESGETRNVRLVLWDMGGQATYRELRRQFMNGAAGAVIVYDVTRPETFMAMNNWFESFREACPDADVAICANKIDLEEKRMVPVEPGVMLRDWFQAKYYETSAKSGKSVDTVFRNLAEMILTRTLEDKASLQM
ncbi:MAG: GTPase KRas protein [Candidatus Thorarchaeota archaeon]|nr:MAG: GTPase KRas protein [Candidatus Thorarchaeota archaeon]